MPVLLRSDSELAAPIRCVLSDVDGVMTDGKIIYDSSGAESKQFNVRDGLGIKRWIGAGLEFGIVTARSSEAVRRRGEELTIGHIFQGVKNKLECVQSLAKSIGCELNEVCYIGDDLPDLLPMRSVGLAVAPADAARDVRDAANWILSKNGGDGAVRELLERLLRAKSLWNVGSNA
ncbi:KdsC family phosphatase [Rhodopirellula sp. MGV]|uniref:KdsC family phosphatase n=1 Tax=Rhodopirellula sp. MGV TaxID=2023130 RepID=UPI000B96AB2A|nr:HAD-IIIA family hydrolase [Rhodopirellula sp. MGV]OYP28419.1 HAD family hydrolase [Rhodopirellula sp. MGV]PNY38705.1 HAD family hydrolase [Rhodopirellula baltica]